MHKPVSVIAVANILKLGLLKSGCALSGMLIVPQISCRWPRRISNAIFYFQARARGRVCARSRENSLGFPQNLMDLGIPDTTIIRIHLDGKRARALEAHHLPIDRLAPLCHLTRAPNQNVFLCKSFECVMTSRILL